MHMPPANLPNITAFFLQRRSGLDPGSGRPQGRRVWLTMNDPLKEQTRSVDQLSRVVPALAVDRDIKDTPGLFGGAFSAPTLPRAEKRQPIAAGVIFDRSEEHTSELQSLMRISYAVFCLKNKNNNDTNTQYDIGNDTTS